MAFLNWVAYEMNSSSNVQDGDPVCPMSNCRRSGFKDTRSFLDHVKNCEWLSDACYWCPQHGYEHFGLHEKDSKFKRAFDIFKVFGRSKSRDLSGNGVYQMNDFMYRGELESSEKPRNEMEADMPKYQGFQELEAIDGERSKRSTTDAASGTLMLDSKPVQELRVSTQTVGTSNAGIRERSHGSAYPVGREANSFSQVHRPAAVEKSASQTSAHKLVDERSLGLDRDTSQVDCIISPISPTSAQSASDHSPAFVSPVSATDDTEPSQPAHDSPHWNASTQYSPDHNDTAQSEKFSHLSRATTCTSDHVYTSHHDQTSIAANVSRRSHSTSAAEQCWCSRNRLAVVYTRCEPDMPSKEPSQTFFASGDTPTIEASRNSSDDSLERWALSTQQCVERLDQLVCMLDTRWQEYLQKCPDLHLLSAGTSFASPFEAGLQGLRQWFSGQRPSKIQDILPLTYFVYACAYMCHCCDPSYGLDELYNNVQHWGSFISDDQDRHCFLKVADLLWSTLHTVSDLQTELQSVKYDQGKQLSKVKPLRLYIPETPVMASQHSCLEQMCGDTLNTDLRTDDRDGLVTETCARVLDGKSSLSFICPFIYSTCL